MRAWANIAGRVAGKSSLYLLGAASGFAIAIPLTAAAVGGGAAGWAGRPAAAFPAGTVFQSPMVNRGAKSARLDIHIPAAPGGVSMVAKSEFKSEFKSELPAAGTAGRAEEASAPALAAGAAMAEGAAPAVLPAPRATQAPHGCLSSIGVTRANLVTDEITICVADAGLAASIQ